MTWKVTLKSSCGSHHKEKERWEILKLRQYVRSIQECQHCSTGAPRGKEREKRGEALFEQIVAGNFPELKKDRNLQIEYTEWKACEFFTNEN